MGKTIFAMLYKTGENEKPESDPEPIELTHVVFSHSILLMIAIAVFRLKFSSGI